MAIGVLQLARADGEGLRRHEIAETIAEADEDAIDRELSDLCAILRAA